MQLIEVGEEQKEEYNNFVATQEGGSFLQSWEWGEWQKNLGRQAYRFFLTDNYNNNIIGSIQLIQMPLPLGKHYLYSPYGPVIPSAPDLSAEALAKAGESLKVDTTDKGSFAPLRMTQFLIDEIKSKFPNAIFIRIEPKELTTYNLQLTTLQKSANIQPAKTLIINLIKSEEQLLAEMHHKTRYNIKLAQKHQVKIKDEFNVSVGHGLFFEEALKLILETSKRQKFATFPASYYQKMIDFFVHNSLNYSGQSPEALAKGDSGQSSDVSGSQYGITLHIYKAIFQNQLLGAAIMVDFGKTRTFLFGGSSEFHKNVMAPYLLHYQAMLDAKANGLEFYDFWGVETSGGETPGFVRFKMGFAPQSNSGSATLQPSSGSSSGEVISYAGAYDIIQNKPLYYIYKVLRKANRFIK